jgi:hypothetical protein
MPKYIINTSKGAFQVDASREPNQQEAEEIADQLSQRESLVQPQAPAQEASTKPKEEVRPKLKEPTTYQTVRGAVLDVAPALAGGAAGFLVGGPVGAAAGAAGMSALGNVYKQRLEQEEGIRGEISKGEVAASAAVSAIPATLGAKMVMGAKGFFVPAVVRATQGGITAVSAEAIKSLVDKGELPEWEDVALPAAVGTLAGGALGVAEKRYQVAGSLITNPVAASVAQGATGLGVGAYVYNDAREKGDPNALSKAFVYGIGAVGATHIPSLLKATPEVRGKASLMVAGPEATAGEGAVKIAEKYQNTLRAYEDEANRIGFEVKKLIEKSANPNQLTADVLSVLDGKASLAKLPKDQTQKDLRTWMARAKQLNAQYSDAIENMPGLTDKQRDIIRANRGEYIRTAYAAHDPRAERFVDFDEPTKRAAYRSELVTNLMAQAARAKKPITAARAGADADLIMAKMLSDESYIWGSVVPGSVRGSPTSALKKKLNLSDAAREWLGEVRDPGAMIANSLNAQARLVLHDQHDDFLSKFLLGPGGVGSKTSKPGYVLMVGDDNPVLHKRLEGIYVPELWAKAYKEVLSPNLLGDGTIPKAWMGLQTFSKALKTVGNLPEAVAPQVLGNMALAASAFKVNPVELVRAAKETAMAYGWTGGNLAASQKAKMFKEFKRLTELGVMRSGAEAEELNAFISQSAAGTGFKDVMAKFSRVYGFPDTFVRYAIFKQNVKEIASFSPGLGMNRIEKMAADLTNDTFPTYERIARRFRQASAMGIANAFGAFEYEVVRTTINQAKYAHKLMIDGAKTGNNAMAYAGVKRAVALASVAGMTTALGKYGSSILGADQKDIEDIDALVPTRDVAKAKIGKFNGDGTLSYAPLNYMMPYANMASALNEALSGRNPVPYLKTMFMGDDLGPLATSTMEAITNNYYGTKVSITDPRDNQLLIERLISRSFLPQFVTGTLSRLEKAYRGEVSKLGQTYSLEDQMLRFGGFRSQSYRVLDSAAVRLRDIAQPLNEEMTGYRRLIKDKVDSTTGQFVGINEDAIYRERNARYIQGQEELAKIYRVLKRQSKDGKVYSDEQIYDAFRSAGVPSRLITAAVFDYRVPMTRGIAQSDTEVIESVLSDKESKQSAQSRLAALAGQDLMKRDRLWKALAEYNKNLGKGGDGLTKLFSGLSTSDGERAKNIKWAHDTLPKSEQGSFLKKLFDSGVLTPEVYRQFDSIRLQEAQRQQGL